MTREEAKLLLISQYARTTANSVDIEHSDNCVNIIYNDFEQHISELEAPKSCLSCKYFSNVFKECNALDIKWSGVIENFYCSEYEPKDK